MDRARCPRTEIGLLPGDRGPVIRVPPGMAGPQAEGAQRVGPGARAGMAGAGLHPGQHCWAAPGPWLLDLRTAMTLRSMAVTERLPSDRRRVEGQG